MAATTHSSSASASATTSASSTTSTSSQSSTITTYITDQSSIAAFNRGPVTATFTPPASCLSTLTLQTGQIYFGHQGAGYLDTACYPASTSSLGPHAWDVYYYSPAQCPSGFSQATSVTNSYFGRAATQLTLGADTTAMVCCPSGYHYRADGHACQSSILSTTTKILYIDPVLNNNVWYSTDANTPSTTTITRTGTSTYWVLGDGIPVWWQSSDLKAFAAATQTSSPISANTQTTSTQSQTQTGTSKSSGLTSGAKIGIGIGIPLAVIAIGLVGFFLYFRRRQRTPVAQEEPPEYLTEAKPELQDTSRDAAQEQAQSHEMYSDNEPHNPVRHHELPS
ncbi:uncharacterized protein PAC_19512 [Phialocephala subalpina]|uniref:Uncharacterized protein n=1 Tax=Phialocephala subalpina TaxID=576137 RepID=A0A1L7XX18_9HELO|nr:uncharacterized protein PAC_19512 [Phialocephala subalpina]